MSLQLSRIYSFADTDLQIQLLADLAIASLEQARDTDAHAVCWYSIPIMSLLQLLLV